MKSPDKRALAAAMARSFAAGSFEAEGIKGRAGVVLGHSPRWLDGMIARALAAFHGAVRPRMHKLGRFILNDSAFEGACRKGQLRIHGEAVAWAEMSPAAGQPQGWSVPPILTLGDLCEMFRLSFNELNWFSNAWGQERAAQDERLRHYRYRWVRKRDGSARLIEAPKQRF